MGFRSTVFIVVVIVFSSVCFRDPSKLNLFPWAKLTHVPVMGAVNVYISTIEEDKQGYIGSDNSVACQGKLIGDWLVMPDGRMS